MPPEQIATVIRQQRDTLPDYLDPKVRKGASLALGRVAYRLAPQGGVDAEQFFAACGLSSDGRSWLG